ncbi:MAG TPA: S9 family peptidase [Ktedonobacteraceae bacterium]|nr:S9 family peptidase [Ktedonobacteraceae bacterium]
MSSSLRNITIEDLYKYKPVSHPRISPDGKRVAFVLTTIDERKQEYRNSIWIVPSEGGEARRFTAGPANAHSPAWSPDGRWLAFVSEREGESANKDEKEQKKLGKGKPQLWLISTSGGEARQLTFMQHGASSPVWSPDSKHILFSAPVGPADEETADGKPLPKVRVIDRLWYRLDGVGYIYERRSHLFLIDANGGEAQQLTDGDWDDSDAAWSPDGSHIAFTSSREEDRWRFPNPDVYTLAFNDGKAGELHCLTDSSMACSAPSWSPDGQTIAFLASLKIRSGGHTDIYTIPANAGRSAATCLTWDFEGSFQDWTNSDIGDEHLAPAPAWSSDGKTIYGLATHRGASRIFALALGGADKQPPTLTPGDIHVRDFSIDRSANKMALLIGSPTRVQEIFVRATTASGELRRVTGFNEELLSEMALSTPEYMPYTGVDGWPMDGWVMKPHDFDPSKKYPLIVEIHGGPATQYGFGYFHEMQLLTAAGYVVLFTNPRGSLGYGRNFSLAVRGAWGEKDSLDIMAGVDALLQKGYIDEQRMGITGGSYGGFMTNWLISHNNRFKVAVTDRSVTNIASGFGSSDFGWVFADDELDTTPWEDLERYMQMSPISYVKNIHTPLLIIHSEQDLRCNIEQAEQLFAALKYMGREVLLVRFEGQSHGMSRGGHPKLRIERLKHILGWFEKHLAQ